MAKPSATGSSMFFRRFSAAEDSARPTCHIKTIQMTRDVGPKQTLIITFRMQTVRFYVQKFSETLSLVGL